ncbi:hypothetical protein KSF_028370 [Reticulibacter mediterranei]|uniref:C-type cytochrome biogenesis protein CcmI n=1 Tax=Reticulibacter mediterranei TaxID=2778369 RepID=A0A8J3ICA7_9CHLR|nr:hypothetical protein [Reticulibacter mediterranei]GHO92789.1 hypothetical protein KSF_028370 [Reticulibacter mediterranei]
MAIVIAIALGLLALAFVLYPLLRHAPAAIPAMAANIASVEETAQPLEREQAARSALQEVELDFQLGNIEEPDYRALRERYMKRALVALKARYEREQELDELIEEQLRTMKNQQNDAGKEQANDARE